MAGPPDPYLLSLWRFLLPGYCMSILIETPVLLVGLSRPHSLKTRLAAGLWLTACTYPVVILILPVLWPEPASRALYLAVAETFAPAAECTLFYLAFQRQRKLTRRQRLQDMLAVILANLCSFLFGLWWTAN